MRKSSLAIPVILAFLFLSGPARADTVDQLKQQVLNGNIEAAVKVGLIYLKGTDAVPRDYDSAFKWFSWATLHGSTAGEDYLSFMYEYGHGVGQDSNVAAKLREDAALKGDWSAKFRLANRYLNPDGTDHNFVMGYVWLKLSIQGFPSDADVRNDPLAQKEMKNINIAFEALQRLMSPQQVADAEAILKEKAGNNP
jgi:TPR repeat protein